jgi:protein TonB
MGDITLGGNSVFLLIGALILVTIGIILFLRTKFKNSGDKLSDKYSDHTWSSPLDSRNKYPDVNAFKFTRPIFLFGLMVSLAATLFAFSWTTFDTLVDTSDYDLEIDDELEIEPPRTAEPPPPPPPPPPPVIEEVPEEHRHPHRHHRHHRQLSRRYSR